jgi:hypothetical protein
MRRQRYQSAAGFEKSGDAGGAEDVVAELLLKPGFGGATVDHAIDTAGAKQRGLSVQEASPSLTRVVLGLPGHAGIRRTIEAVIRPRIQVQLDRHAGAAQSIRIGQVFFKEEIETPTDM